MADAIVGSVAVDVVPSAERWNARLRASLLPQADRLGQEIGKHISDQIRDTLRVELQNLPGGRVNVDADTDPAHRKLVGLGAEMDALGRGKDIKVGADTRQAEAAFARLRAAETAGQDSIEKATARVSAAQNSAADASGQLRVAQQRLDDIQAKSGVSASALAAAEERVAAAQRKTAAAADNAQRAQNDLAKTRSRSGANVTELRTKADTAQASAQLALLKKQADDLDKTKANIKVDVDKSAVDSANASVSGLVKTLALVGPAAVPLAGAGTAAVLAFGGSLTAAGAGAASLALVGVPAIKNITTALKDADTKGSAALNHLTQSEKDLYGSAHAFTGEFKQFTKDLEPDVLPIFANGVNLAAKTLPRFEGTVRSAAAGAEDLIVQVSAATKGPVFHDFITNLQHDAGPAVESFGTLLIDTGKAGAETLNYLEPLEPKVDSLIKTLGQNIATGANSAGFHGFLDTIVSDAPIAGRALGDIGKDAIGLVGALEPLGRVSLEGLDALAKDVQPLIPDIHNLTSAIEDNAGAISPVLQGYAHLAVEVGGGLLGSLTALVNLLGRNATAFQILAGAALAVKLGNQVKDVGLVTKAYTALEKARRAALAADAAGSVAGLAGGAAGVEKTAVALGDAEKKSGAFSSTMSKAGQALGKVNIIGLATTGIVAGVAAGFIAAGKETAQFNKNIEGQFKSATSGLDLYHASGIQAKLSTDGLIKSGDALLATWANMGADNPAVTQLVDYRAQAHNVAGAEKELAPLLGVSADQFGDLAKQAGISTDELDDFFRAQAIGDTKQAAKDYADIAKTFNTFGDALRGASDPSYQLAQAMKDLDSNVPVDKIKDVDTALESYSTIVQGTVGSSAQAGDALANLKTIFDKHTTAADKAGAAQKILSGDLLLAGPQTRQLAEDLTGLNSQYTANLEATYKAADGANNLAQAGAKVSQVAKEQKTALYNTLVQMGLSTAEASKLAEKFGSIPKSLQTKITLAGQAEVKHDLDAVVNSIAGIKPTSVHVKGDITDAKQKLANIELLASNLPKAQQIKIEADVATAQAHIETTENKAAAFAKAKFNATLGADNQDAIQKSDAAHHAAANYAVGKYGAHLDADDRDALAKAAGAKRAGTAFSQGTYEAQLHADDKASAVARDAQNKIDQLHGKDVAISATDHASEVARDAQNKIGQVQGKGVTISASVSGLGAVESLRDSIDSLHSRSVTITENTVHTGHAGGGQVHGPGDGSRDTFMAPLANDEFVVKASQARKNLPLLYAINNGQQGFADGGHVGYASGGKVQYRTEYRVSPAQQAATSNQREALIVTGSKLVDQILAGMNGAATTSKIATTTNSIISKIDSAFSGSRRSQLVDYVKRENRELATEAKARDAITAKLTAYNSARSDATTSAKSFGSITNLNSPVNGTDVARQFRAKLKVIQDFDKNLRTLAKRGLSNTVIQELVQEGPDAAPIAAELVHTSAGNIHSINSSARGISAAAGVFGTLAARSEVGGNLAKDFASGLEKQKAAMSRTMSSIAESMAREIRRAFDEKAASTHSKPKPVKVRVTKHDTGGDLPTGLSVNLNETGSPEPVLNPSQAKAFRVLASGAAVPGQVLNTAALVQGIGDEFRKALAGAQLGMHRSAGAVMFDVIAEQQIKAKRIGAGLKV